ncbi:hypothetical protein CYMTET_50452 [Cymbomonas tetramitiformis]|uniref:Uncharacterized protein n=1 Tax=Cymbomonas tetramitiformis TaxID=36881 RepID=A0AAE0BPE1_9CHLO|nr:hypothetical protein CYMTET_50452 [Cymbomonas tetramitiformis]
MRMPHSMLEARHEGHWLSATAFLYNNTGDSAVRAKAAKLVATLHQCMVEWAKKYGQGMNGYLFPYDPLVFKILERESPNTPHRLYSVPFYTLHKLMAGLLDQYTHAGNAQAFEMVQAMGEWVARNVARTLQRGGQSLWQSVLGTEWGGMNEVMFNLYNVTGNPAFLKAGYAFNHWSWSAPLASAVDDLAGNHANTHIPEVIGNARGYELTGNLTDRDITMYFFDAVTTNHSFATGGSNDGEHWGPALRLGDELNANTEESCTQYNMLKVARHLFQWSAEAAYADFYERAILNGILGNQNLLDPDTPSFIYMLPLGGGGIKKPWGKSNQGFPCCWGSLSEQFSKMSDSIYFRAPDDTAIFVNQFVSSTVSWTVPCANTSARAGPCEIQLTQVTDFPVSNDSTTELEIEVTGQPQAVAVRVRVPAWAGSRGSDVRLNGVAVELEAAGSGGYLEVERVWASGDRLRVHFPMHLWASPIQDDRAEFNGTMAWMYGPLVLAGLSTSEYFVPASDPFNPSDFISRDSDSALVFSAKGKLDHQATSALKFIPLYQVMEEAYTVYYHTRGSSVVPYNPKGAVIPTKSPSDFEFLNGASEAPFRRDASSSGVTLRTGDPGQQTQINSVHAIIGGKDRSISNIHLQFRYVAGYTPPAGREARAANLSVVLLNASSQEMVATIYTSPPLGNYSYDDFTGYSPFIQVAADGLRVANDSPLMLAFIISNNQRNLQIPVEDLTNGFAANVTWHNGAKEHGMNASHGRGTYWKE